jgi:hypothetical protein
MANNGMTIDDLNTVAALTAQDEVPVWDNEASGEPTKKVTGQNLANSVKSLANLPNTTEMNDAIAQSTAKVKELTAVVPVSAYTYALGGYYGNISIASMSGYDDGLSSRTLAYIPISCYFYANASVAGVASIMRDNSVLVNGSNAGDYYIRVLQIYI